MTSEDPFETPRSAAHFYADLGWRVIPTNGVLKHPTRDGWQKLATTDHAAIDVMFDSGNDRDVCIATGEESGIFVLDVDPRHGGDETLQELCETYGALPDTVMSLTGGGGFHYLFKWPEGLDIRNNAETILGPGLDLRGNGGQISAPPSGHGDSGVATGNFYNWEASSEPGNVPVADAPQWLIELITKPAGESVPRREKKERSDDELLPGDIWMADHDWADMLEEVGAIYLGGRDGYEFWSRPPMPGEHFNPHIGATLYYQGSDSLHVFTPNWPPLENNGNYDKARFWVAYHQDDYEGDTLDEKTTNFLAGLSQEAKNEEFAGFLEVQEAAILADREAAQVAAADSIRQQVASDTSWTPKSLTAARHAGPPPAPDYFYRDDDEPLLYKGRIHYFYGAPECGKSWGAQMAAVQVVLNALRHQDPNGRVLYLDFENDVRYFVERMMLLGLPESADDKVVFIEPDTRMDLTTPVDQIVDPVMHARCLAFRDLLLVGYDLLVVDGVSNAMGRLGMNPLEHADAVNFETKFLKPLANISQAAVVCIDHAPKSSADGRPSLFGAQHKLAAVTGASFLFEQYEDEPFGRDRKGRARITIMKDKPGYLRRLCPDGKHLADLVIESKDDRVDVAKLVEPIDDTFVPTNIMEEIAKFVNQHQPVLESTILNEIKGKLAFKKLALKKLLEGGYLNRDLGRQQRIYEARPFVETDPAALIGGKGPNVAQKERLASGDSQQEGFARSIGKANTLDRNPTHTFAFPDDSPLSRVGSPDDVKARVAELEADEGFAQASRPRVDPGKPSPDVVNQARERINRQRKEMGLPPIPLLTPNVPNESAMQAVGIKQCSHCKGTSRDSDFGGPCGLCGGRGYLSANDNANHNKPNKLDKQTTHRDSAGSRRTTILDEMEDEFLDDLNGSGLTPTDSAVKMTRVGEEALASVASRADESSRDFGVSAGPFSPKGVENLEDDEDADADGRNWDEEPWGLE